MAYTDTFLVEKLKEILLRLYPSPKASALKLKSQYQSAPSSSSSSSSSSPIEEMLDLDFLDNHNEEGSTGIIHNYTEIERRLDDVLIVGNYTLYPPSIDKGVEIDSTSADLTRNLHEFIQALKMSLNPTGIVQEQGKDIGKENYYGGGKSTDLSIHSVHNSPDLEFNLTLDDILDLNNLLDGFQNSLQFKHFLIIFIYFLIACVSIVGNLLVVQLVIRSRRLHTLTHALLANLAVADLFMATLNMPFSAARVILAEWPFGSVLCHLVPFVQVTSVYVTSVTMTVIALDRYSVIMNPLGSRMKSSHGIFLVFGIWILSALLSLPYAIHHKVVTVLTVGVVKRCQAEFGSIVSRRWLTVLTFLMQYLLPLILTTASYVSIMQRLRSRSSALGSTTPRQMAAQSRAKRKTIKMLVLTVVFFAVSWAPINIYHLLTHFTLVRHDSTAILVCHLIAMSSCTVNPFIYCWFNEHFRREALKWMRCFRTRRCPIVHPAVEINGMLTRADRNGGGGCHRNQSTTFIHTASMHRSPQSSHSQSQGTSFRQSPTRVNCPGTGNASSVAIPGSSRTFESSFTVLGVELAGKSPGVGYHPESLFLVRMSSSLELFMDNASTNGAGVGDDEEGINKEYFLKDINSPCEDEDEKSIELNNKQALPLEINASEEKIFKGIEIAETQLQEKCNNNDDHDDDDTDSKG